MKIDLNVLKANIDEDETNYDQMNKVGEIEF